MSLLAVGLNHTTAPVDLRERLAFPAGEVGEGLAGLVHGASLSEVVLLSTCNRVEVYAVQPEARPERIVDALASLRGVGPELVRRHCFVRQHEGAARHIFRVAASLESMVVGEPQILGQVKDAWKIARERQTVGPILDRCLTMAFRGAKRVRSETDIARGGASVASVAVDLARSIFGELNGTRVALLGAGEMARHAALHLRSAGASDVTVVNRSPERALELANAIAGRALGWDRLEDALIAADVILASTGAREPVIELRMMKSIMRKRRGRPIFFVDIAVPRDVEPKVGELDGVYVYDVDDLQKVLHQNLAARGGERDAAGKLLEQEITAFLHWQRARAVNPIIRDLREHTAAIVQGELERALHRLGELTPEQRKALEQLGHCITQKFLHRPLTALRDSTVHPRGLEGGHVGDLGGAVRALFGLTAGPDAVDPLEGGEGIEEFAVDLEALEDFQDPHGHP